PSPGGYAPPPDPLAAFFGTILGSPSPYLVPDGMGGWVPFTNSRVMPDGTLRPYDPAIDGVLPGPDLAPPEPDLVPHGPNEAALCRLPNTAVPRAIDVPKNRHQAVPATTSWVISLNRVRLNARWVMTRRQ